MTEYEKVLSTECNQEFIKLMNNRMVVSFYKYGPIKENYGNKLANPLKDLEKRLKLYNETGNTEWLVDAANDLRIEFEYPQHKDAHFKATDSKESPGLSGMSIREIEVFKNEE